MACDHDGVFFEPTRKIECDGNSDGENFGLLKTGDGGCYIKMCMPKSGIFELLMKDWECDGQAPDEYIFKMSHGDQETCTFTNKKYSANIVGDIPNCLVYGMSPNKDSSVHENWLLKEGSCGNKRMCVIDCFKNPFYFYVDRDEQAKNRFRLKGVCESTDGEFRFPDMGNSQS